MRKEFPYFKKAKQTYPLIDVRLEGPKTILTIKALVDSGASFSLFRSEVAEALGINIKKGMRINLEGIGGRIVGYLHSVPIQVLDKPFSCKIVFSSDFDASINLLGRDNFFFPFLIIFNEKLQRVCIEDN